MGIVATVVVAGGWNPPALFLFIFLGGLSSIPWMIALAILIGFFGLWLERHTLVFCTIGPVIVAASWALVVGKPFLEAVAGSCVASSGFYLLFRLFGRHRMVAPEVR